MKIGSLFSGIGGLELGLEWAGVGHVVWQVERDPFPRSILAKHWPSADRSVTDVREAGSATLPYVDVICGGFPCQDISYAGKGAGLAGERSGLWYEFARVIREMGPRYVVIENVSALIARGLDQVLGTLADIGYDAEWRTIRASDVGAPHRRERLFIVAYRRLADTIFDGWIELPSSGHARDMAGAEREAFAERAAQAVSARGGRLAQCIGADGKEEAMANCDNVRWDRGTGQSGIGARIGESTNSGPMVDSNGERWAVDGRNGQFATDARFASEQTARGAGSSAQSGMGRESNGLPEWLDRWPSGPGEQQYEWEHPRTARGVTNRAPRLKALGNAVVPAVAREVGRWLLEIDRQQ